MSTRIVLAGLLATAVVSSAAAETEVPPSGGAELTLYHDGTALVRDRRALELRPGLNHFAFARISRTILPESVMLRPLEGAGLRIVERSFDRDVVTPRKLLERAVGAEVWVSRTNPASGAVERRRATLVSVQEGVLVESEGRIESVEASAIGFDAIPESMRRQATLVATVEADAAGRRDVELAYLSSGISWQADYVIAMSDAPRLELEALATVANGSGMSFPKARLSFVAGDVNRVAPPPSPMPRERRPMAAPEVAAMQADMPAEAMAGAHLYRLDHAVDLGAEQIKQVSLFGRRSVAAERRYVVEPQPIAFHARQGGAIETNAALQLVFRNDAAAGLGVPLPGGVVRVYRRDSGGAMQFQGEDRLRHTAVGGEVRLTLGRDVDLPVKRVQKSFQRVSNDVSESAYEITLRNTKDQAVAVTVKEAVGGDWEILEQSAPHRRDDAATAAWSLTVPAGGETVLHYRVRVKGY